MAPDNELTRFLLSASRFTLKEAMLARRAASCNLRKQIEELLDELIDETWKAELFFWFSEHGEELTHELRSGPNIFALPRRTNAPLSPHWRKRLTR